MFPENTYIHINSVEEARAVCEYYALPENGGYDHTDLLDYAMGYPYFAHAYYDDDEFPLQIEGWIRPQNEAYSVLEYEEWAANTINISDFEAATPEEFRDFILAQ